MAALPPLDVSLALGIGPSTVSTSLESGAKSGGISFGPAPSLDMGGGTWITKAMPWIAFAGVLGVAAFVVYKMRR